MKAIWVIQQAAVSLVPITKGRMTSYDKMEDFHITAVDSLSFTTTIAPFIITMELILKTRILWNDPWLIFVNDSIVRRLFPLIQCFSTPTTLSTLSCTLGFALLWLYTNPVIYQLCYLLRRHEDLKQMLDANKDNLKLEAMKRIVAVINNYNRLFQWLLRSKRYFNVLYHFAIFQLTFFYI